ncbi:hypothetical protein [Longispora albida]|uniref:hypothetical protein n=1 Tax=Longispora albida TaxID=203523 RepID=UPI00039E5FF6|nr:hypothetical protein [Longispora albida]
MRACRLHITGASGTGTTCLGQAIADQWSVPHADADFWEPSTPPYTTKHPEAERISLMRQIFLPRPSWVLSGAVMGWGDELRPYFDALAYQALPLARATQIHGLAEGIETRLRAAKAAGG